MEFGLDKCVALAIKKKKIEYLGGIQLQNGTKIQTQTTEQWGILEANFILRA